VREFALSCLGEIGDLDAVPAMVNLLKDRDTAVRDAAAAHLALLTKYDFGHDAAKWNEWHRKRLQGLAEQVVEDREDEARRLKLQMRGKNTPRDEPVR
jgi:HEAT repeat protein